MGRMIARARDFKSGDRVRTTGYPPGCEPHAIYDNDESFLEAYYTFFIGRTGTVVSSDPKWWPLKFA